MSITRRTCVTLTVLGLLAGASLWPEPARAQRKQPVPAMEIDGPTVDEQTFDGLSIPKDREATAIIAAVVEYVKKKDWDTAARSLQYLLEKPEDSFFEVTRKDENGKQYTARISIRIEANRLIGDLPPEGLEVYRQKYGQRAMMMLTEGKEKNDPAIMSQVALKYRHTEAGVTATKLLGNYFLDRGNYQLASGKFQELLEMLEKEKPEVKKEIGLPTFYKAALAYHRFGDAKMGEKLWAQVVQLAGDKGVQLFGPKGPTFTLEQLRKELDRNAQVGATTLAGWPLLRGDPSRTATGIGGPPFLEGRWSVSMFVPDQDYLKPDSDKQGWLKTSEWVQDKVRSATDMIEKNSNAKRTMLPGFFPIAGNNRVIFRTYDGIYSFIIRDDPAAGRKAGELDWASESLGSLHKMGSEGGNKGTIEQWWAQYAGSVNNGMGMSVAMPGILFENSAVGTLSHDNKFVYYVDDLAMPPHPMIFNNMYGNTQPFGTFTDQVLHNTLKAIEMDTGRLKWEVGERKQGGRMPILNPNQVFRRQVVGADGKAKIVQVNPDGTEVDIDPKTGQPVKKPEAPVKAFVPKKDLPDDRGFVNAADELMDTYFLGPPLPIGGRIYVLVEYNGELQLCCINPNRLEACKTAKIQKEGPELVWRQPLGTANQKLLQDSLRRTQPCHLAYNDGILVCPTNAGAIVAVNLLNQSLAWAYSYRTGRTDGADGMNPGMMGGPGMGGRVIRRGRFPGDMGANINLGQERWYPAPPAIVNGTVVFTAPDSNSIVCLSLRDGKRLWAHNRQPGDLYMAGVYNNKVLVVAKDSIRALKLSDGLLAWDRPRPIGMPSGQGVASKGKYYLPCRAGVDTPEPQIVEVDIDTGEMHATKSRRKEVPGNLVFFDGEVISQSISTVAAFPQLHVKLAEMKARLAKNPNDPRGLTDLGELHFDKGELIEAVADLKKALDFKPDPDTRAKARLKLYEALTELLQKNFGQGEEHLTLYKELCLNEVTGEDKIKRQSAYLCLLGKGREAQGKLVDAFDAYMEFGQLNNAREMVPSVDEPGTLARPDVWARGRILAMISKAKADQKKPLEERIAKQWQEVKASDDLAKIKSFVQVFGSMFTTGLQARLTLAERLAASTSAEDQRQAELYLDMVRRQGDDLSLAAQATEALARFMVQKKQLRDAVLLYRVLGTDFKDVKLPDGRTGAEVYNELVTDKRLLPYLQETSGALWPAGKMKSERVNGPFNTVFQAYFSLDLDGEALPFFKQNRLVIDTQTPSGNGYWQLRLVDRATGETKWKHPNLRPHQYLFQNFGGANMAMTGGTRIAQVRGHLLMLSMEQKVYVWDVTSTSTKPLWEYSLMGKGVEMQVQSFHTDSDGTQWLLYADGSRVRLGHSGLLESSYACLSTRDGLVALDPATGTVLWKREAGASARLFGDSQYIFVVETGSDGSPSRTQVVRAADGVSVKATDFGKLYHPSRRVGIIGRNLLVFDDDPQGGKALRLHDVLTGEDVWRQTFPAGSKVARAHNSDLAGVVQPDGTLTVFNAADGKVLLKAADVGERIEAGHLENVQELALFQDRDYYYVALNKAPDPRVFAIPFVSNGLKSLRVHGTLYSYAKASRTIEWFREMDNHFVLLEHIEELPILIFGTMVQRNNQGQNLAEVEAVQKRGGKSIGATKLTANNGQFYAMHTDPKAGVIELMRYDLKVRFSPEGSEAKPGEKSDVAPPPGPLGALPPGGIRIMPAQQLLPGQAIQIQVQALPAVKVAPIVAPPGDAKKPEDPPPPKKN